MTPSKQAALHSGTHMLLDVRCICQATGVCLPHKSKTLPSHIIFIHRFSLLVCSPRHNVIKLSCCCWVLQCNSYEPEGSTGTVLKSLWIISRVLFGDAHTINLYLPWGVDSSRLPEATTGGGFALVQNLAPVQATGALEGLDSRWKSVRVVNT